MRQKALIVDSSRLFQKIVLEVMSNSGVECFTFSSAKEALEATHDEYSFILVSRTLEDLTGEIFLRLYEVKNGLGDALTMLLTSNESDEILAEANKAGYKLVVNKKNIESLQDTIIREINTRTLSLEANVLLVEDSQSSADLIINIFGKNNSKIQHVRTITEMRSAFLENNFDLVLTDYYLKGNETGDEVISYIRNFDEADKAHTPIIVLSAETNKKKRTSFLRNGANDFVLKPFDEDELLVRTSNLVRSNRVYQQSKRQQKELTKLALTDQLTGLYNRHSLYDIGPKYISNAHRHKTPLSLLVIDLDHFKNINDTRGHSVGDIVLQSVSTALKDSCRTGDMVARFGGEEFVMMLTNCNVDHAVQKAEQLRQLIEGLEPEGLTVTTSIGISELIDGDDFDLLFDRADKAVYMAKDAGRNRVMAD